MKTILLIIETPISTDPPNFQSEHYDEALKALSELAKRNKDCELITGNVLQIAIEKELHTFFDVLGLLKTKEKEGVRYKYVVLDEGLTFCEMEAK